MKSSTDGFRDEALAVAFAKAIAGDVDSLYDRVRRASGLPGPSVNSNLVRAFAAECAGRGAIADPLIHSFLAIEEDVAFFGHVDEIFPILGVAAAGARVAKDSNCRAVFFDALQEAACDRRSRVRDEVGRALATALPTIGAGNVDSIAATLREWIGDDQPYLAHAVFLALTHDELLVALDAKRMENVVDDACARVAREHRGGRRHDGYRKMCRALGAVLPTLLQRWPELSAVIAKHALGDDENLRDAIEAALEKMDGRRFVATAVELRRALEKSKKPSRDPRWDRLPGRRGRGKR